MELTEKGNEPIKANAKLTFGIVGCGAREPVCICWGRMGGSAGL